MPPDVPLSMPVAVLPLAGGEPTLKDPIPWWRSEAMWGGVTAAVLPAALALLVYYGALDTEGAALWGGLATAAAGLVVLYGRMNGGTQPSPIAKTLLVLPLLALLASCVGTGTVDHRQTLAELCLGYGNALQTLAVARAQGTLGPAQVAQVDGAILAVGPMCRDQEAFAAVDADTIEQLRPQLTRLAILAAGASK